MTPRPKSPPKTDRPIDPDAPLRLDVAAKIAFPFGGMGVSGLRREIKRGRLAIETIAGKQFTTLNAIERMRELCRDDQHRQDSGSNPTRSTPKANGNATPPEVQSWLDAGWTPDVIRISAIDQMRTRSLDAEAVRGLGIFRKKVENYYAALAARRMAG